MRNLSNGRIPPEVRCATISIYERREIASRKSLGGVYEFRETITMRSEVDEARKWDTACCLDAIFRLIFGGKS